MRVSESLCREPFFRELGLFRGLFKIDERKGGGEDIVLFLFFRRSLLLSRSKVDFFRFVFSRALTGEWKMGAQARFLCFREV